MSDSTRRLSGKDVFKMMEEAHASTQDTMSAAGDSLAWFMKRQDDIKESNKNTLEAIRNAMRGERNGS